MSLRGFGLGLRQRWLHRKLVKELNRRGWAKLASLPQDYFSRRHGELSRQRTVAIAQGDRELQLRLEGALGLLKELMGG